MAIIKIGTVFPTNNSGDVVVLEYIGPKDIIILFKDGTTRHVPAGDLRRGLVKNNFQPSVNGKGFLGDGVFRSRHIGNAQTSEYRAWTAMLSRCYSAGSLSRNPTYLGCSVCDAWLNFQVFAEWYTKQNGFEKGFHLDKDHTVCGNKVYSPQTCQLIPQEVNKVLLDCFANRGEYPQGVCYDKRYGTFVSVVRIYNTRTHLGTFATPEHAFAVYKKAKEAHVKEIAAKYQHDITQTIYNNLINYAVSITD